MEMEEKHIVPTDIAEEVAAKECDLVMKGGITSGIVYPPLAIKLHNERYCFRNVGGTSAGAVAAAVTAAAELGRKHGFQKLNEVRKWLGEDRKKWLGLRKVRNLLNLFQPSRSTAPLLRTFLVYPKLKRLWLLPLKLTVAFLCGDPLFFLIGVTLGVGLSLLFTWLVGG